LSHRGLVFGKSKIALEQSSPSIFVDMKRLIPRNLFRDNLFRAILAIALSFS
jgi:hypothetical protein